ncbi:hypothetical protein B0H19DRAFT_541040 [Mycena capillaripes]|nr:hypothetical protein B0H19DRAFT_541040 [Mycena capillaripes]
MACIGIILGDRSEFTRKTPARFRAGSYRGFQTHSFLFACRVLTHVPGSDCSILFVPGVQTSVSSYLGTEYPAGNKTPWDLGCPRPVCCAFLVRPGMTHAEGAGSIPGGVMSESTTLLFSFTRQVRVSQVNFEGTPKNSNRCSALRDTSGSVRNLTRVRLFRFRLHNSCIYVPGTIPYYRRETDVSGPSPPRRIITQGPGYGVGIWQEITRHPPFNRCYHSASRNIPRLDSESKTGSPGVDPGSSRSSGAPQYWPTLRVLTFSRFCFALS